MSLPGSASAPAVDRRRDDTAYDSGRAVVRPAGAGAPPPPDHDQAGLRERHRRDHGVGRLDQRRAAPVGHRLRGSGRPRARRLQPDRQAGAAPGRHQAPRQVPHVRSGPHRGRAGGAQGAARRRSAPRRLPDGDRQDHGREPRGARPAGPRRRGGAPAGRRPSTRRAASPSCSGSLAPKGAVVKVAGIDVDRFEGPARVFDGEDGAMEAILAGTIQPGDVVVIRYEGPKGGPGMREMLAVTGRHEGRRPGRRLPPSSPTDGSPAAPTGSAWATSRPKRWTAGPSPSCAMATASCIDAVSHTIDLHGRRPRSWPGAGRSGSCPSRATPPGCWPSTPGWPRVRRRAPSPKPDVAVGVESTSIRRRATSGEAGEGTDGERVPACRVGSRCGKLTAR